MVEVLRGKTSDGDDARTVCKGVYRPACAYHDDKEGWAADSGSFLLIIVAVLLAKDFKKRLSLMEEYRPPLTSKVLLSAMPLV